MSETAAKTLTQKELYQICCETGLSFLGNNADEIERHLKEFEAFESKMASRLGDTRGQKERLRDERLLDLFAAELEDALITKSFCAAVMTGSPPSINVQSIQDIGLVVLVIKDDYEACQKYLESVNYQLPGRKEAVKIYCLREKRNILLKEVQQKEARFKGGNLIRSQQALHHRNDEQLELEEFDDDDEIYLTLREQGRERWLQNNVDTYCTQGRM